jgi:hypothetical protein
MRAGQAPMKLHFVVDNNSRIRNVGCAVLGAVAIRDVAARGTILS